MKATLKSWLYARIALYLYAIVAGYSYKAMSNIPWSTAVIGPAVFAAFLFVWLTSKADDAGVDWKQPFSLTKPFFPMARYPMHSTILSSAICILLGTASTIHAISLHNRIGSEAGLILLCGVFTLIAALGFWFSPGNAHNRANST